MIKSPEFIYMVFYLPNEERTLDWDQKKGTDLLWWPDQKKHSSLPLSVAWLVDKAIVQDNHTYLTTSKWAHHPKSHSFLTELLKLIYKYWGQGDDIWIIEKKVKELDFKSVWNMPIGVMDGA